MTEPGTYNDCQYAAITILRGAGIEFDEFAESDIPCDGTMEATVSNMVQCYGDLAYLGIVAALTRMAVSGIARIAHAENRSFEEELDGYLSVLDQQADNDASDVRAESRAGHRRLAE